MKTWKKYVDYLLEGEWHIHTNYTDGKNTVFEYCEKAVEIGIPLLAFTEHVRKELTYDFNQFLNEIEEAREEFDLIILSGCEAKVLPSGALDVEEWILREVDYPIFAFHSFPEDVGIYIESLKSVLRNRYVNTWAHPGAFLLRYGLELSEKKLNKIFTLMEEQNVLLEVNKKYKVPLGAWLDVAERYNVKTVTGNDVHSIEDLETERSEEGHRTRESR
jgi:DNA polymerase (family 10)/putative hydrolase